MRRRSRSPFLATSRASLLGQTRILLYLANCFFAAVFFAELRCNPRTVHLSLFPSRVRLRSHIQNQSYVICMYAYHAPSSSSSSCPQHCINSQNNSAVPTMRDFLGKDRLWTRNLHIIHPGRYALRGKAEQGGRLQLLYLPGSLQSTQYVPQGTLNHSTCLL